MTSEIMPVPKIGFAGLSHLGIVSSICWSSLGFNVVGVDPESAAASVLAEGRISIHEPKLLELLTANRCNLSFSQDLQSLSDCEVVYVTLDVAIDETNSPLLEDLTHLVEGLTPCLTQGVILVIMSQVPVGFCRNLTQLIRTARPTLDFELYHWVETLVIGDAVNRCLHPERIIIGSGSIKKPLHPNIESILSAFPCPVFHMSLESAELTKAAINTYLSVSVSVSNVLADLCEATGASMRDIVPALRTDRRIGQYAYIQPGLGIAGGNLERDLRHLQQLGVENGIETGLLDQMIVDNSIRYRWVQRQLEKYVLSESAKPTVALWGLAYKKGTESTQNSFAVKILRDLTDTVAFRAYDPVAKVPSDLQSTVPCFDRLDAIDGADCLVVLTDWEEFSDNDFKAIGERMRTRVIIDCVNALDGKSATDQGFRYFSLGNPEN